MAGSGGFEPPRIGFAGRRPILSVHSGFKPKILDDEPNAYALGV